MVLQKGKQTMRLLSTVGSQHTKPPSWFNRMTATNEYNLPRVPIPQLQDTLERYLKSIQPLVSTTEFAEHKDVVEHFRQGTGRKLQDELLKQELADKMGRGYPFSYIERYWDRMYLGGRYESPINVNPGYGLVSETDSSLKDPLVRSAVFISSMLKWFEKMKTDQLEQDPKQCMASFAKQFGTAKIPKFGCDVLKCHPRSTHIVVLKDNAFYKVHVLSPDGKALRSAQNIANILEQIANVPNNSGTHPKIATLTAENRDTWANIRSELVEHDPQNKASLDAIDSALFVFVLEGRSYLDMSERTATTLHGSDGNRWFDKLQIISYPDGHLACNFEHSFSDGTAWNRWLHEVWHDMRGSDSGFAPLPQMPELKPSSSTTRDDSFEPLTWNLSSSLKSQIDTAEDHYNNFINNNESKFLHFDSFGKKKISKQWSLSPDGVVQMAYQLAFQRLHQHTAATYESCATRSFLHGRTETIRSATNEANRFVSSVLSSASKRSQKQFLTKAVHKHVELAKLAQQGMGCDRHLTMLNETAQNLKLKDDPLLTSFTRAKGTNFEISSSNVTMPFLEYFTFGAVVPTGYGVGYMIQNDSIPINITSFKDCDTTSSIQFSNAIQDALLTIKDIAETN